jgi:type VI protein secretion system component VasK
MALDNISTGVWRIIVGVIVAGIISVGGWVFSEVRDMPAEYTTQETHQTDVKELREDMKEQTGRIEGKVDGLNDFLRDYFANQ